MDHGRSGHHACQRPFKTEIGSQSSLVKGANSYRSAIDETSEETKVGYYKVDLTDYQIKAELTATSRCGFQRYTYPQDKDARVMIDLKIPSEYDYQIVEGSVKQTGHDGSKDSASNYPKMYGRRMRIRTIQSIS